MSCPHGMPTPGSCIDCMDEGLLPPPPRPRAPEPVGDVFRAQYDGACTCGLPISVGQRITRMDDDTYRHAGCE